MSYTHRADLLIAAGKSIKMQEAAGIEPKLKYGGMELNMDEIGEIGFQHVLDEYEIPLAVIEGRRVYVGDELWCKKGIKHKITDGGGAVLYAEKTDGCYTLDYLSWNPPKPPTIMIEVLREDAEYMSRTTSRPQRLCETYAVDRIGAACRKALESTR